MDFVPLNISLKNTRLLGAFLRVAGLLVTAFFLLLYVAFSPAEWALADEEDEEAEEAPVRALEEGTPEAAEGEELAEDEAAEAK